MPPDADPPSDPTTKLVRAAVRGDGTSRDDLVRRFTPLLLAQARYRLPRAMAHVCEPEDLVQECWAIALPRLPDLRLQQERMTPVLLKFLATTMLRLTAGLMRRHVTGRPSATDSALGLLPAEVSGVITQLCRREGEDALQKALAGMPAELREVLVLRGIEQQANSVVARLLRIDDSVVTRRFQSALELLRNVLPADILTGIA
jgi:DNA-directed RNA polymerase specialized sigma24 family protein